MKLCQGIIKNTTIECMGINKNNFFERGEIGK